MSSPTFTSRADSFGCDQAARGTMQPVCLADPDILARSAFAIAVLGIAIGISLMVWTWSRAVSMSADGAHYMELAERAWRWGARTGMDWYAGPGYPVVAGWLYGLIGDLDFAGRSTSFLFGLATLLGVGILAFRLFGHAVAFLSVGLLAVHTTFVRHAVMAETDAAYGCWLVWSILLIWELRQASCLSRQAFMACLAGLTLGLGYLTRPEAAPLAGLLCLWYLFQKRGDGSALLTPPLSFPRAQAPPSPLTPLPQPRRERRRGEGGGLRLGGTADYRSPITDRRSRFVIGLGRRLAWTCIVALIFVVTASPYLVRLRAELGRWSLSGKERSIVLKFVPDKRNYEEVLKLGVSGALLRKPSNILHWLPYHLHWGVPQFVKSLNPIVLVLATVGVVRCRRVAGAAGSIALLLWVSVPFILFFFLTFPGRRYFMQAMPQWTILAAVGTVEIAGLIARWRSKLVQAAAHAIIANKTLSSSRRAFGIALAAPTVLMVASTLWGNRNPIEQSLSTERAVGERILQIGGAGRRVLTFTVAAFYARGERVPLWGPMQGVVRCHGYGKPLSYEDFVNYVRRHRAEYVVLDQDLRADCPEFLDRVRPEDFELVADDIVDQHGPHLVFRTVSSGAVIPHAD